MATDAETTTAEAAVTEAAAKSSPRARGTGGPEAGEASASDVNRAARKVREGIVSSIKMDKTAVVTVTTRKPHPKYRKSMVRTSKLFAHDESNEARVGDRVRIAETRPLSKLKRWRLVEVLERAK